LQQCVHSSKNAAAKITGKADDRPCQAGQHRQAESILSARKPR